MRSPLAATALTVAVVLAVGPVGATEISLPEALERARQRAHEVAAAEAGVAASRSELRQARSYRYPNVRLEELWINTDSPADVFGLELNQERFSFGDFTATDPNDPDRLDNFLTRLELTLPLYTGGEVGGRIDQARLAADADVDTAAWTADRAALAAALAYIQLSQAREQVDLLERSVATIARHVEVARAYTEQGMLVRSELLRAEVEHSRMQDLLSEARGGARVAEANLSFRLAAARDTQWELDVVPDPGALEADLAAWLASANERRDLVAARRRLEIGTLEARIRRSALKPKIGLLARYDWNDDTFLGDHGDSSTVMLTLGLDLWSGNRHRAAAAAASARAEAAAYRIEQFADAIRLDVEAAYERAATARERHETARHALGAARETVRITEERFRQGVVRMLDLLDANTAQREAETRELVSRAEALRATFELAVAAGRAPESVLPDVPAAAIPATETRRRP